MTKSSKNPSGNNAVATDYVEVELAKEEVTESRQFVTFVVGNEVFAVDMAPVQEIIRVPEVVRVPLAPDALDGLTNLRGKVLPIISLRRMFGFEELTHDDSTRAVVIDIGQPLGFVVDRVASVVGVDQSQIEGVDDIRSTVNADLLSGIIKKCGEHEMVMVLDFEKLILREFTKIAEIAKSAGATTNSLVTERSEISDELQLVSFVVDQQEYAINIEDVQEIVQVPSAIIQVPHSQSHALGT
jgi:purine-binding chemotaxis protein CheW